MFGSDLDPANRPRAWWCPGQAGAWVLAIGLMLNGDLDEATLAARAACRRDIRNHIPRLALAAVLLAARQPGQARPAVAEAYRLRPDLSAIEIKCLVGARVFRAMQALGARGA